MTCLQSRSRIMSDKVLVTTESIQKQLPIKRSSQQRGVQIFRENLILKASTQNLPPSPPPLTRSTERIFMRPQILGNVLNTFSPERFTAAPLCLIYFQPIFWADYKKWDKKVLNCTHIPSALRKWEMGVL